MTPRVGGTAIATTSERGSPENRVSMAASRRSGTAYIVRSEACAGAPFSLDALLAVRRHRAAVAEHLEAQRAELQRRTVGEALHGLMARHGALDRGPRPTNDATLRAEMEKRLGGVPWPWRSR